jgi:hypothetical protein
MFATQPILCKAAEVWSDDFDDGNYDGWTVQEGEFSATNHVLEITNTEEYNLIYHESTTVVGTWSFDMRVGESTWMNTFAFMASNIWLGNFGGEEFWFFEDGYYLTFGRDPTRFTFAKFQDGTGLDWATSYAYIPLAGASGWQHIDITRNNAGEMNIFINGTLRIEVNDTDISTSDFVCFCGRGVEGYNIAIDNVTVSDSIDITPTTTSTTETTETTTEETTTTTTTSPTPTGDGIDTTMMLLIGGGIAAVVVVLLIVWKMKSG